MKRGTAKAGERGVTSAPIAWNEVRRVLVIRLRSIGDTVLATPSLIALRKFLPAAQIDVLLEDWVAPVLENFEPVDNVLTFRKNDLKSRLTAARDVRRGRYDVVFNLHGGTTATFFARASGARHRVGIAGYQYSFFYNHLLSSPADFWGKPITHSAEQQLALLGFAGVPVADPPKTRLFVGSAAVRSLTEKLRAKTLRPTAGDVFDDFALIHPAAAFATKQWAAENFARAAEHLHRKGLRTIAAATAAERETLDKMRSAARVPVEVYDDLTLPEMTALASKAKIFVGGDSGIAHIAAAVGAPSVVIFGSSNINHWRPWTDAPHEIVYEKFPCQPCAGYVCKVFDEPKCILSVTPESVIRAIDALI